MKSLVCGDETAVAVVQEDGRSARRDTRASRLEVANFSA